MNSSAILPRALKPGDTVALLAPARKISPSETEHARQWLVTMGWQVWESPKLYGAQNQYSGTAEERAKDINLALETPEVRALWFARGGYGSMELLEHVNWHALHSDPKWLCGYSDMTALLNGALVRSKVATIHGTMPVNTPGNSPASLQTLRAALAGEVLRTTWQATAGSRQGSCEGILIGGNLSLVYALLSTPYMPIPQGAILFLEDLDEYLYHIHRMMMALKLSGVLNRLGGLVVGSMSAMRDNAVPFGQSAEEIIADVVKEFTFPVAFGFPAGHQPDNRALRIGVKTALAVSEDTASLIN